MYEAVPGCYAHGVLNLVSRPPLSSLLRARILTRFRQCSCAHFSGLIILLANLILSPSHPYVSLDQQIANKAVRLFEDLLQVVTASAFHTLQRLINDLHSSANAAVAQARLEAAQDDDVENIFTSTVGQGGFEEQDIGFPSFIGDDDMTGGLELDGPMWDSFAMGTGEGEVFGVNAFHTA